MANITAIQRRVEFGRFYAEAELTEDGAYIKGQLPDDYAGGFVAQIHVCYAIVSTDQSGRILLTTYNPKDLMDKVDKTGAAIKTADPDGFELRPNTNAEVTEEITLVWAANAHVPSKLKVLAENMWEVAQREMGEWYV